MNPFSNNQVSKDNNPSKNSSQPNPNFLNFSEPYSNSIIQEEEVQMLLDNDNYWQSEQKTNEKQANQTIQFQPFSNSQQNQSFTGWSTNQFNQTNFPQQNQTTSFISAQQTTFNPFINQPQQIQPNFNQNFGIVNPINSSNIVSIKTRNNIQRVSKLDDDIMRLIKENDQNSTASENVIVGSKANSKIQEKNKKAVSRLSQHFFAKNGHSEDQMKSKRKNRHTIAQFGAESKKNSKILKDQTENEKYPNHDLSKLLSLVGQPQKMQVEQTHQEKENQISISNSPSKKQSTQLERNIKFTQNRLSDVKRKRQRLSLGIEGLQNLMKLVETDVKEIKPQPAPVKKQIKRVTMDFSQFMKSWEQPSENDQKPSTELEKRIEQLPNFRQNDIFNIEKEENKQKDDTVVPQIIETLKHLTDYTKPSIKPADLVIHEDEKQDQFTPIKQRDLPRRFSFAKFDLNLIESNLKSKGDLLPPSKSQIQPKENCTQEIFNFQANLRQKIEAQKKKCEELAKQKTQVIKDFNNKMSLFTINAENLAEWKKTQQDMRTRIYQIKQKINKEQYEQNCQYIDEFELKLGIEIHKVSRVQKDGFYVEFSYDDIGFRIQRNDKPPETKAKFLYRVVDKKVKKDFEFGFEEKTELIQSFINKKLKNIKRFIPFMMGLVKYVSALQMFEYTIVQFAYTTNMSNLQITEKKTEMEFYITVGSKFEFLFTVDLMELLSNGGITIFSVYDRKNLEIPEEFLAYRENGNKIGKCIIFMEKHVAQLMKQKIENVIKMK